MRYLKVIYIKMYLAIIIFNHLFLMFNLLEKKNDWEIIQLGPINKQVREGERVEKK